MVVLMMVSFLLQENFNAVLFLPHLIAHLSYGVFPFRVAGDVQYAANRTGDLWLLTLINNQGILKLPTEPTISDDGQCQQVAVILEREPSRITDWLGGQSLNANFSADAWRIVRDLPLRRQRPMRSIAPFLWLHRV